MKKNTQKPIDIWAISLFYFLYLYMYIYVNDANKVKHYSYIYDYSLNTLLFFVVYLQTIYACED